MDENSESNLKIRRHIRSSIVFQISLICGLVAAALVLVPLFAHYAGMIPEVTPRDFADSPVQKAIDQYSLQAEGNITTLERIINKTLNVPVSTNEDGNLVVEYQGKRTTLDSSYILSEETIAEPTIAAEFASVEELAANGSLKAGDIVRTQSFYAGANRGGATYDVVAWNAETQPDGMSRISLANGLVAVIRPQNGMVSVDQLGAHADNSTDDYPYIQVAIDLGYKTVAFEGGDYRFNRQLELSHSELTILGNDSTLHYYDEFQWAADRADGDYAIGIQDLAQGETIENVYLQNLNLYNEKTDGDAYTVGHTMVRVNNAAHIELYKCDVVATDKCTTETKLVVTNLDVRKYWYDVIFDSCTLIDTTFAEAGGTIWVGGGMQGTGKLVMRNNYIEKSCHDETIGIFGNHVSPDGTPYGYVDDVLIDNNTFVIDESELDMPSSPVFNFGYETLGTSNVSFTNNDVTVKAAGNFFTVWNIDNVTISNNDLKLTLLHRDDIPDLTGAIFSCNRPSSKNATIEDNSIFVNAAEEAQMGYLARGYDSFRNNEVNLTAPMGALFGECVKVDNNTIYIDTSDFKNYIKSYVDDEKYHYFSVYAWREDVPNIISFTNNRITFNEILFEYQDVRIVAIDDVEMSGTSLEMSDDVIESADGQERSNKTMLSITGCQDTDGTSSVYALRNDSSIYETLDVSDNEDDGLYLVIDDESVASME